MGGECSSQGWDSDLVGKGVVEAHWMMEKLAVLSCPVSVGEAAAGRQKTHFLGCQGNSPESFQVRVRGRWLSGKPAGTTDEFARKDLFWDAP